jgi:hypothetical protein
LIDGEQLLGVARPTVAADASRARVEQPARLVAVDLTTAGERWSVALRDPVYRGSTPLQAVRPGPRQAPRPRCKVNPSG